MLLVGFVALLGFVVNCVTGRMATARREYMGGMIAVMGIALWVVTVLGIAGLRGYRAPHKIHNDAAIRTG